MEIKVSITNVTHDDLVNLLSTATFGSNIFSCKIPMGYYKGTELEDPEDCLEDKWAKVLLAGKKIYVFDYQAEDDDEFYGNLNHLYCESREAMRYDLTLADIVKGLEKMMNDNDYYSSYVQNFISDNECFDQCEAECIMQHIVFGEEVYG